MVTRFTRLFTLAALTTLTTLALAQPKPPTPGPASTPLPNELKISLMDGSLVAGKFSVNELTIETKFGILKVPVDQIRSFSPGLDSHPDFDKHIASLLADLSSDAFNDREKAGDALQKMGPEIKTELERALKTADGEKQSRLQKLVEDFETQKDDDSSDTPTWIREDTIVTPSFTIVGKITTSTFSITSPYGKLDLKLADIRTARRQSVDVEEIRKTLAVSGNDMSNRTFETTGIKLAKGDQVIITATGTIAMNPWGGNQVSTPDGGLQGRWGVMQPGNIPTGCLIARIGDAGNVIKVGSKSTFTADHDGVLQFSIAIQQDMSGNQFPGEYSAKIRVVKKPQ